MILQSILVWIYFYRGMPLAMEGGRRDSFTARREAVKNLGRIQRRYVKPGRFFNCWWLAFYSRLRHEWRFYDTQPLRGQGMATEAIGRGTSTLPRQKRGTQELG
jgi:hypothetical protein